jgi:Flp pilus assembly protein TadG
MRLPRPSDAALPRPLRAVLRVLACGRGAAVVEFAIVLPVLVALFAACFVLGDMIACQRKVTQATHQLADIVSRSTTLGQGDVAGILAASAQVLAPYSAAKAVITVSEVQITTGGKASVLWSQGLNGTALAPGSVVALPPGIAASCGVLILGQVAYAYKPVIGFGSGQVVPLGASLAMSPRYGPQIPLDGVTTPTPGCS